MPVIASAEKKMRQDKKRTKINRARKDNLKKLLKEARKNPNADNYKKAQSAIDKLVKVKVIHKNKGSRLKSRLVALFKKLAKTNKETVVAKKLKVKKTKKETKN